MGKQVRFWNGAAIAALALAGSAVLLAAGSAQAHTATATPSDTVTWRGVAKKGAAFGSQGYFYSTSCQLTSNDESRPVACSVRGVGFTDPATGLFTAVQTINSTDGHIVFSNVVTADPRNSNNNLIVGTGTEQDAADPGQPRPPANLCSVNGHFTSTPLADGTHALNATWTITDIPRA